MDYRLEQLRFELREDPSSRSFFKLGEHLRREGELDEAIEILRAGLEKHDRYVAAWVSLGRAQLENGNAEEAQISLERGLQLDPENAVASRAMGEAAIVNGDWLTAVKALKRARGLSPRDDALDERIDFVEKHLDELGLLQKPAPVVDFWTEASAGDGQDGRVGGEEPFAVQSAGDTGVWDDANDVFAAGMVGDDDASEDGEEDEGGDDSPFEVADDATDESGAYAEPPPLTEDDVASIVEGDESLETAEMETVADGGQDLETETAEIAEGPVTEPEQEPDSEPFSEPEAGKEDESDAADGSDDEREYEDESADEQETVLEEEPPREAEPEPLPESWPDPEPDVQPELEKDEDGIPLPTMTLARLAIDQGDLDLAERTLRGVIERDPENSEAAELLETLVAGPPEEDSSAEPQGFSDPRVGALQRWLDAVRLASERLKT